MSDLAKLKRASPPCPRALPETDLLSGARFEEFQAVAPRIFGVEAASAGERIVVGDFNAVRNQILAELVEFCRQKSRMSFLCGPEFGFHADMELLIATLEPAAASRDERSGLCYFTQPEKRAIEFARRTLAGFWSGQLNVVNSYDHLAYTLASIPPPGTLTIRAFTRDVDHFRALCHQPGIGRLGRCL